MDTTKKYTIKTSVIISTVLLLFFLSGCGGGFIRGRGDQLQTYDFRSGSEGLMMQWIEGMPPEQVYIGTDFSTGIRVINTGAFDVTGDAEITLKVPDETAFQFKEGNTKIVTLRGRSLYTEEGEQDVMMFPMKALCFPGYESKVITNYTRKLKATACYYYETTANADLCVDTQKFLRQPHERPECEMRDVVLSGGQGGPVGVAKINPSIIPQSDEKVTLQLSLSFDKLQGIDTTIYSPDTQCDVEGQNKILISAQMGGQPLACEPSMVELKERRAVGAVCKIDVDSNAGAYLTPISINMQYYVEQKLLRDLTVEPAPGEKPAGFCEAIKSQGSS